MCNHYLSILSGVLCYFVEYYRLHRFYFLNSIFTSLKSRENSKDSAVNRDKDDY